MSRRHDEGAGALELRAPREPSQTSAPAGEADGLEAGAPPPGDRLDTPVERAVRGIRRLGNDHALRFALDVGALVVREIYGGDIARFRQRGKKDASFRELARHDDLPISASQLYVSVAVYELVERLGVDTYQHVPLSHARAVLPLPEEEQGAILRRAVDHGWTLEVLQAAVARVRARAGRPRSRGGRRALPRFVKVLRSLERYTSEESELDGDLDAIEALDAETAARLELIAERLTRKLDALRQRLRERTAAGE